MSKVNAKKPLTIAMIDRLQPGEKTHTDPSAPGLYVHRNTDGTRSWRYVRKAKGIVVQRTRGTTAEFSIVEARQWAADLNRQIAEGINPNEVKERSSTTFESVWTTYMASIEDRQAPKTIQMKRCRMRLDVLPVIGAKPISEVTLDDLWGIAQRKMDAGLESASNHLVADIKAFFNWCQSHGRHVAKLNGANPATHLKKLGDESERTRFIDVWELPLVLRAMAEMPALERRALTLMLLTGQRLDNVLNAEYDQWKPEVAAWVIMKMKGKKHERVPNVLPLAPWGRSLFVRPIVEQPWRSSTRAHVAEASEKRVARYLFPSTRGDGPRIGHMRALCDDLMAKMQALAPAGRTIEHIIPHDFRRTLKSHLARLKVPKEHRHAIAGHREGGIDKHYMMYEFMDEKAAGLAIWEAAIIRIAREEGVADALGIPAEPVKLALVA